MSLSRLIWPLVGSLLWVSVLQGEEAPQTNRSASVEIKPLTLVAAEQLALQRNADQAVAQAQVEVAAAQLRSAREFPNPSLNFSVSRINSSSTESQPSRGNGFWNRSYDSIVALNQLVEIGKRSPRRESARAGYRAAEAQRDDVRRLLIKAVAAAYVAALEAKEESRILADSASSLRREADLANRRLNAGDIAATDKAQIEITATERELDAGAAQQAATAALVALETLLGDPAPSGRTLLADSLSDLSLHTGVTLEDTPKKTRSDIAAAEAALAKAEADLSIQRRQAIPDLTLGAQFEHNPPDSPDTVGLAVGFPLPLWNRNGGGIRAARAARDQAKAQLDKVRAQANADVISARSAYAEARSRADLYRTELVAKSAEVVRTVRYAYEHGGATLIELLTAERNDNEIRLAAARAEADAASTASALVAALDRSGDVSPLPLSR